MAWSRTALTSCSAVGEVFPRLGNTQVQPHSCLASLLSASPKFVLLRQTFLHWNAQLHTAGLHGTSICVPGRGTMLPWSLLLKPL